MMDKGFALKNNCKEFNFFEPEQRYLPGDNTTDCLDEDSRSSAVTRYFRQIGRHALLSHKDEVKIAKRIEAAEHGNDYGSRGEILKVGQFFFVNCQLPNAYISHFTSHTFLGHRFDVKLATH